MAERENSFFFNKVHKMERAGGEGGAGARGWGVSSQNAGEYEEKSSNASLGIERFVLRRTFQGLDPWRMSAPSPAGSRASRTFISSLI